MPLSYILNLSTDGIIVTADGMKLFHNIIYHHSINATKQVFYRLQSDHLKFVTQRARFTMQGLLP